eukprot:1652107-Prymnesium_polylepis.1
MGNTHAACLLYTKDVDTPVRPKGRHALSECDLNPQAPGFAACKVHVSGPRAAQRDYEGRPPRRTVT